MARSFSNNDALELTKRAFSLNRRIPEGQSIAHECLTQAPETVDALRASRANEILARIKVKPSESGKSYRVVSDSDPNGEPLSKVVNSQNKTIPVRDEDGRRHNLGVCLKRALECSHVQLESPACEYISSRLLVAALVRERALPLERRQRELAEYLQAEIPRLTSDIDCGTGTLSWLFAPRDSKERAEKSYAELKALLDSGAGREMEDGLKQCQALKRINAEDAWAWYAADKEYAEAAIEELSPGFLGPDEWTLDVDDARRAFEQIENVLKRFNAHKETPTGLYKKLGAAIRKHLAQKTLGQLKKIPVEELNRGKLGIRVKTLESGGCRTVADVYGAPERRLSFLNGITPSSARTIKEQANLIAKDISEETKLRLSVDDKSAGATKVVCVVYAVHRWEDLHKRWERLSGEVNRAPNAVIEDLAPATKRLVRLFASKETRDRAVEAYQHAPQFCDSKLAADVIDLMDRFDNLNNVKVDSHRAWNYFEANPVAVSNLIEQVCPDALGKADASSGLPEKLASEVQDQAFYPEGLKCTLRRYQEMGVKYILHQKRTLLGDEMGLGKTIQAIASMVSLKNAGESHFVVVCPASVLENWCREIVKHSSLHVVKIHGPESTKSFERWRLAGGVAVTTYETTRKLNLPGGFAFGLAVVDEAHYIKNPDAARTVNTLQLIAGARRVVLMTGTALENRAEEMLTLVGYLRPRVAKRASSLAYKASARRFRDELAPVYYRRKREDVLSELPELIESQEWCTLGPAEMEAYVWALKAGSPAARRMRARRVSWNVKDPKKNSSKARRLLELIADAQDDGRKVLVFTFFLDTAASVSDLLGKKCVGTITGSLSPKKRQELVEKFDAAPAGSVLVSQIQAGGTGMNIQSASVVVFCEPQYKPSIENQAVSRAYRMGQTRSVLAYRLLCERSVDERILEILQEKQSAFDAFADKSSAAAIAAEEAVEVGTKEIGKIIQEEIERIKTENPELVARVEREMAEQTKHGELEKA